MRTHRLMVHKWLTPSYKLTCSLGLFKHFTHRSSRHPGSTRTGPSPRRRPSPSPAPSGPTTWARRRLRRTSTRWTSIILFELLFKWWSNLDPISELWMLSQQAVHTLILHITEVSPPPIYHVWPTTPSAQMKKYCTTIRIIVHTQMKLFRRRSCTMIYTFSCFF